MHSSPEATCNRGVGGEGGGRGRGRGERRDEAGDSGERSSQVTLLALPRQCQEVEAAGLRAISESEVTGLTGDLG